MEFDITSFNTDLKKGQPDNAARKLLDYLQLVSPPVFLPDDLLRQPSQFLRFNMELLTQLEEVAAQKAPNSFLYLYLAMAKDAKRVYQQADAFLGRISLTALIVYSGYWYEIRRFQEGITMFDDPNTIEVINTILNRKLILLKKNGEEISGPETSKAFYNLSFLLLGEIFSNERLRTEILQVFNECDFANHLVYLLQWIPLMGMELNRGENGNFELSPNDESNLKEWKRANLKYQARFHYFINKSGFVLDEIEKEILESDMDQYRKEASLRMWSNQYKYLAERFPEIISWKDGNEFASMNYFNFVNTLAQHANSRWNHLLEGQMSLGTALPQAILSTVVYNSKTYGNDTTHVFCKDYDFLKEKAVQDSGDEGVVVLDFIIQPIGLNEANIDLNLTPMLKIGTVVYWFPGIIANKDYGTILQNRLYLDAMARKEKQLLKFEIQHWTGDAPKFIESIFRESGYEHTITEKKYTESDIDLAVFKDGYLFVFEIKYTFARSEIMEIKPHTNKSLQKAKTQIEKHLAYLSKKANIDQLLVEMGVAKTPEAIKIVPFILDNSFEGDGAFVVNGVEGYKLGNLELEVLLRNEFSYLLSQERIIQFGEKLSELSYWSTPYCSPADFVRHIANGLVWQNILEEEALKIQSREIPIDSFNLSYKY